LLLESNQKIFFEKALESFDSSATQSIRTHLAIADKVICLVFANQRIQDILIPAIAHLVISPSSEPDLTIFTWDRASSKVAMPPAPWSQDGYSSKEEVSGSKYDRYKSCYQHRLLHFFDRDQKKAIYCTQDFLSIPYWEKAAPFRLIFHWFFEQNGAVIIHSAAIGIESGGVLLAGKGGSGKSTTALSSLQSELRYAGDDYSLVILHPKPIAFSLYTSAKLHWPTLKEMEFLEQIQIEKEEKALLFLYPRWKEKLIFSFPIRAILLPQVSDEAQTKIVRCSPAEGLLKLAPSSIFQFAQAGKEAFEAMAALIRSVPCYKLLLAKPFSKVPQTIIDFLRKI
jgi:hypothetical protein